MSDQGRSAVNPRDELRSRPSDGGPVHRWVVASSVLPFVATWGVAMIRWPFANGGWDQIGIVAVQAPLLNLALAIGITLVLATPLRALVQGRIPAVLATVWISAVLSSVATFAMGLILPGMSGC